MESTVTTTSSVQDIIEPSIKSKKAKTDDEPNEYYIKFIHIVLIKIYKRKLCNIFKIGYNSMKCNIKHYNKYLMQDKDKLQPS